MYNLNRNNYNLKPKSSTIYTPKEVSQFIFELLQDKVKSGLILDPCSGQGSLLEPWKKANYPVYGVDYSYHKSVDYIRNFLDSKRTEFEVKPQLILCNPPFNGYGKQLGSEVWLAKIIELFGKDIPLVLFAPIGFRLNLTLESKRHEKFDNGTYPPICSSITLPKNIFKDIIFHSEILIFNIQGLKAHYFLPSNK